MGHIKDEFLWVKRTNQQEERYASIQSGPPHRTHNNTTNMQYEKNIHNIRRDKRKWIYTQRNGPSVTKPNTENCKNRSSKCAYDCAQLQYTLQHRTVLIISLLTSRQTS